MNKTLAILTAGAFALASASAFADDQTPASVTPAEQAKMKQEADAKKAVAIAVHSAGVAITPRRVAVWCSMSERRSTPKPSSSPAIRNSARPPARRYARR